MTRAITAMPPRELRDFASPLLQVPLNRLFISRPIPRYIPPQDRNPEERTGCRTTPITSECMAALMVAAKEAENGPHTATTEVIKKRKVNASIEYVEYFLFNFFVIFSWKKRKDFWKLKLVKNWRRGNRKNTLERPSLLILLKRF